jgi:hypothetical protein
MAREMDSIERIRAGPSQGMKPPDQMSPQELHAVLWQVLTFRDSGRRHCFSIKTILTENISVVKKIEKTIGELAPSVLVAWLFILAPEKIPGLGPLIEKIMDSISGE